MKTENNPMLYMVGVGPGDPSLMTLKAVDLINTCDVLLVPVRKKGATRSMSLDVVQKAMDVDEKKIVLLPFPMVKGAAAIASAMAPAVADVTAILTPGKTGVFITLGCSTIYSTAGNLFLALKNRTELDICFVPGVSSINATAAASTAPLVFSEENLVVLPATYAMDQVEQCIRQFNTVVLMKAHTHIIAIKDVVRRCGLLESAFLVEKAAMAEETFHLLSQVPDGHAPHYMSTVVIKTNKEG